MPRSRDLLLRVYYRLHPIAVLDKRTVGQEIELFLLGNWYLKRMARRFGAFVPLKTKIGPGLNLVHGPQGLMISGEAQLGANVTILHSVTIGRNMDAAGSAPVIGDGVFVGAGAIIIGRCRIGNGAKIGAGVTLVNVEIPENAVIVNRAAYDLTNDRWVH